MAPVNLQEELVCEVECFTLFVTEETLGENDGLILRVDAHIQTQLEVVPVENAVYVGRSSSFARQ